ncbi:MAG: 4Fe-4S dicluster domain-containing protein [Gammaproteobacteria bacterium]
MNRIDQYRRKFLGTASAAIAGIGIAPGILLQATNAASTNQGVSDTQRWGLLIDTNRCEPGCDACVRACNQENGLRSINGPETDAQWIRKVSLKNRKNGHVLNLPVMCQHCAQAPCIDVCPTGASFRRADGIVLVDKHICIGCRYCMMACPYKARSFIHETLSDQLPHAPRGKGTVESCTLCVHKIDRGDNTTACVEACPNGAMLFGDLNDPDSAIAKQIKSLGSQQLRKKLDLDTGVRYQGIPV